MSPVDTKHPLERDPLVVLSDVARMLRTRADQRARAHGMTRAQWMILARVERQPGLSQNELAALVEVEPITVARLIDRASQAGTEGLDRVLEDLEALRFRFWSPGLMRIALKARRLRGR